MPYHLVRLIVERWLGRTLSNDETISMNAYRPHTGADQKAAFPRSCTD